MKLKENERESHKYKVEKIILFLMVFAGKISEAEIRSIARLEVLFERRNSFRRRRFFFCSFSSKLYEETQKYAGILYPLNINNFHFNLNIVAFSPLGSSTSCFFHCLKCRMSDIF